jgi:signal transduction histidine kinase
MSAEFSLANSARRVNLKSTWLHRWIYPLTTGFMYAAVLLRAVLIFQGSPLLGKTLIILLGLPLIFLGSTLIANRLPWLSALLLGLELLAILSLLLLTHSVHSDFFDFLFAIPSMQAVRRYSPKVAAVVVGVSALMNFFGLLQPIGVFQALALTMTYTAISIFLVACIGSANRSLIIQERQQALTDELLETNRKLERHSNTVQQLAAGRERQRLARELHDSVTQTIFSMTLATQSARFLVKRDRQQVIAQLDRLDHLVQSALLDMQMLITQLAPETQGGSFLDILRRHLEERKQSDNLSVNLEVEGNQTITPVEEANLFRIAQEALNNVIKHAQTSTATLRLHLADPFWMGIEDCGVGFDPRQARGGGRIGLAGMRERAAEIGWIFEAVSAPGQGTLIRVRKGAQGK